MQLREAIFAVAVGISATLIIIGVARINDAAGLIAAGILLAGYSWLILGGDDNGGAAT